MPQAVLRRNQINKRVIRDLKKRSTIGIVFYVIVAFIIIFTDNYYERNRLFSLSFLILLNGICIFRVIHLVISRLTIDKYEKLNNYIFIASVVLTAAIWGGGFTRFLIQDGEYESRILMAICTAGLASGGAVAFLPYLHLSVLFNLFMLIPPVIGMLYLHTSMPLVIPILLYSIYLILIANRGNREYWEALETEFLLEKKTDDLKKISRIDVLTELFNRRHFDETYDYEWKRSIREKSVITLLIADLDHFKQVNDQYGHLAGDEYLKLAAKILSNIFKRETDFIARYGGEEFVVLMTDISLDIAFNLAEKVRGEIESSTLLYNQREIRTTLSIGVASLTPKPGDSKDMLIGKADAALYRAKREGRNRVET